jgi:hypothetical protein
MVPVGKNTHDEIFTEFALGIQAKPRRHFVGYDLRFHNFLAKGLRPESEMSAFSNFT